MRWTCRPWGGEHNPTPPTPNPFAGYADTFRGGEPDPTDRGWALYKEAAVDTAIVGADGIDLEPVRGGIDPTGSLWFSAAIGAQYDGFLVYKDVGPAYDTPIGFDVRARLVATNSAQDDDPPVGIGEYRYVVLAVHDPVRPDLNYVHIGIGADPDGLEIEVKTTDADGVTAQSVYPVVEATGTGAGLFYDVRIVRHQANNQVFDCYYRPTTALALTSNADWILHTTIDRSDDTEPVRATAFRLPDDVQVGLAVYASPEVHDIHGRCRGFVILTTES